MVSGVARLTIPVVGSTWVIAEVPEEAAAGMVIKVDARPGPCKRSAYSESLKLRVHP
jgi:hypothetical protein